MHHKFLSLELKILYLNHDFSLKILHWNLSQNVQMMFRIFEICYGFSEC